MQDPVSEQAPAAIVEQGAALYSAEKAAKLNLELSIDGIYASEESDDGGEYAGETAVRAEDSYNEAVRVSDDFAAENIDELHEAAVKEAAQRVAAIYDESERDGGDYEPELTDEEVEI